MTLEPKMSLEAENLYHYVLGMIVGRLRETPSRLLRVLCDGRSHSINTLIQYLPDTLGNKRNVKTHICAIRERIEPLGLTVVCELRWRRLNYRLVRLLSNAFIEVSTKR